MRELTDREKRTVRIGTAVIAIYLVLFGGLQGWKSFAQKRSAYQQLVKEAQGLRQEIQPYDTKVVLVKKLMEYFSMDPAKFSKATVVAQASAAIQKAAATGGVQVGPIREEYTRGSTKELATIKLEGNGPLPAVLAFLYRLEGLGYPLLVDSVQIGSETGRPGGPMGVMGPGTPMGPMGPMPPTGPPGAVKLSLTIIILNFEQWKNEETPNA